MQRHLNYIGSKHSLLEWISQIFLTKTGWTSFQTKRLADLFAGSGSVSFFFRQKGSCVLSNDIEPCSYIVAKALTETIYTPELQSWITQINRALAGKSHQAMNGFLTRHYSPYEDSNRKFFTVDNAKRIDYVRAQIESSELRSDDKTFLLASLLVSADKVANCASIYGAYLKQFKKTAEAEFELLPIHIDTQPSQGKTTCEDVCSIQFLQSIQADLVYLDPPYNQRQYSKNYFPLSVLALPPQAQEELVLTGVTGIPSNCFSSPFCQKRTVNQAFRTVLSHLNAKWIFLSYNSESLLSKDEMVELLKEYGTITVVEREYKRFSSKSGEKKEVKEYLFCLER
jgi:adenine-specific DNA-methyltransferase